MVQQQQVGSVEGGVIYFARVVAPGEYVGSRIVYAFEAGRDEVARIVFQPRAFGPAQFGVFVPLRGGFGLDDGFGMQEVCFESHHVQDVFRRPFVFRPAADVVEKLFGDVVEKRRLRAGFEQETPLQILPQAGFGETAGSTEA